MGGKVVKRSAPTALRQLAMVLGTVKLRHPDFVADIEATRNSISENSRALSVPAFLEPPKSILLCPSAM